MLTAVLNIAIALFPVSELVLTMRRRAVAGESGSRDRGSLWALWIVITLSVLGAVAVRGLGPGRVPLPAAWLDSFALALLIGGLVIRWYAIFTLGRFFTVDVAIARDHRLVQSGLYRFVRHPSYSGLLLAFAGLGLSFHNWLSFIVLMLPIAAVLALRIAVEERALRAAFGAEYDAYAARTSALVPGLF